MIYGLISCCKKKKSFECKAKQMYCSQYFKNCKTYMKKNCDDYFILSAKYGLLKKDEAIKPYDLSLNEVDSKYKNKWSIKVIENIGKTIPFGSELNLILGKSYKDGIISFLNDNYYVIDIIKENNLTGIGKINQFLKNSNINSGFFH